MRRFVTSYRKDGKLFGGEVDALDYEHARQICDARGLGEAVEGILFAVVKANENFGPEQADAMTKAFSESADQEPPDASEFGPIQEIPNA